MIDTADKRHVPCCVRNILYTKTSQVILKCFFLFRYCFFSSALTSKCFESFFFLTSIIGKTLRTYSARAPTVNLHKVQERHRNDGNKSWMRKISSDGKEVFKKLIQCNVIVVKMTASISIIKWQNNENFIQTEQNHKRKIVIRINGRKSK